MAEAGLMDEFHQLCFIGANVEKLEELIEKRIGEEEGGENGNSSDDEADLNRRDRRSSILKKLLKTSSPQEDLNLPLHYACCGSQNYGTLNEASIRFLMKADPSAITKRNYEGHTPLHLLCKERPSKEMVQFLLDTGNSHKVLQVKGMYDHQYPLHVAVGSGASDEVVEVLCQRAPSTVKKPAGSGLLPLHFATYHGTTEFTLRQLLTMHPVAVRKKDTQGNTPLHLVFCAAEGAFRNKYLPDSGWSARAQTTPYQDNKDPHHLPTQPTQPCPGDYAPPMSAGLCLQIMLRSALAKYHGTNKATQAKTLLSGLKNKDKKTVLELAHATAREHQIPLKILTTMEGVAQGKLELLEDNHAWECTLDDVKKARFKRLAGSEGEEGESLGDPRDGLEEDGSGSITEDGHAKPASYDKNPTTASPSPPPSPSHPQSPSPTPPVSVTQGRTRRTKRKSHHGNLHFSSSDSDNNSPSDDDDEDTHQPSVPLGYGKRIVTVPTQGRQTKPKQAIAGVPLRRHAKKKNRNNNNNNNKKQQSSSLQEEEALEDGLRKGPFTLEEMSCLDDATSTAAMDIHEEEEEAKAEECRKEKMSSALTKLRKKDTTTNKAHDEFADGSEDDRSKQSKLGLGKDGSTEEEEEEESEGEETLSGKQIYVAEDPMLQMPPEANVERQQDGSEEEEEDAESESFFPASEFTKEDEVDKSGEKRRCIQEEEGCLGKSGAENHRCDMESTCTNNDALHVSQEDESVPARSTTEEMNKQVMESQGAEEGGTLQERAVDQRGDGQGEACVKMEENNEDESHKLPTDDKNFARNPSAKDVSKSSHGGSIDDGQVHEDSTARRNSDAGQVNIPIKAEENTATTDDNTTREENVTNCQTQPVPNVEQAHEINKSTEPQQRSCGRNGLENRVDVAVKTEDGNTQAEPDSEHASFGSPMPLFCMSASAVQNDQAARPPRESVQDSHDERNTDRGSNLTEGDSTEISRSYNGHPLIRDVAIKQEEEDSVENTVPSRDAADLTLTMDTENVAIKQEDLDEEETRDAETACPDIPPSSSLPSAREENNCRCEERASQAADNCSDTPARASASGALSTSSQQDEQNGKEAFSSSSTACPDLVPSSSSPADSEGEESRNEERAPWPVYNRSEVQAFPSASATSMPPSPQDDDWRQKRKKAFSSFSLKTRKQIKRPRSIS